MFGFSRASYTTALFLGGALIVGSAGAASSQGLSHVGLAHVTVAAAATPAPSAAPEEYKVTVVSGDAQNVPGTLHSDGNGGAIISGTFAPVTVQLSDAHGKPAPKGVRVDWTCGVPANGKAVCSVQFDPQTKTVSTATDASGKAVLDSYQKQGGHLNYFTGPWTLTVAGPKIPAALTLHMTLSAPSTTPAPVAAARYTVKVLSGDAQSPVAKMGNTYVAEFTPVKVQLIDAAGKPAVAGVEVLWACAIQTGPAASCTLDANPAVSSRSQDVTITDAAGTTTLPSGVVRGPAGPFTITASGPQITTPITLHMTLRAPTR